LPARTPVSEFAAAGGDADAGGGCGDAAAFNFRFADDQRAPAWAHSPSFLCRSACDGRRRLEPRWRVPWQGGRGEARGRGVGRWGTEVRGAAASANYEDIALPATIPSILIARQI